MAQLERPQRQVETTKAPPTIHTMEQLLRGITHFTHSLNIRM